MAANRFFAERECRRRGGGRACSHTSSAPQVWGPNLGRSVGGVPTDRPSYRPRYRFHKLQVLGHSYMCTYTCSSYMRSCPRSYVLPTSDDARPYLPGRATCESCVKDGHRSSQLPLRRRCIQSIQGAAARPSSLRLSSPCESYGGSRCIPRRHVRAPRRSKRTWAAGARAVVRDTTRRDRVATSRVQCLVVRHRCRRRRRRRGRGRRRQRNGRRGNVRRRRRRRRRLSHETRRSR